MDILVTLKILDIHNYPILGTYFQQKDSSEIGLFSVTAQVNQHQTTLH